VTKLEFQHGVVEVLVLSEIQGKRLEVFLDT
jgi:hypothetical protein